MRLFKALEIMVNDSNCGKLCQQARKLENSGKPVLGLIGRNDMTCDTYTEFRSFWSEALLDVALLCSCILS